MLESTDQITMLQSSLALYRRMLELVGREHAALAGAAPAALLEQLADLRREIANAKADLRAFGVLADDLPGDLVEFLPPNGQDRVVYLHALIGRLGTLRLPGPPAEPGLAGPLAELYVERALTRLAEDTSPERGSPLQAASGSLAELLSQPASRLLLAAPPGSGKSTSLSMLALACVERLLDPAAPLGAALAEWGAPPLPLLLSGQALAEQPPLPQAALLALLERQLAGLADGGLGAFAPELVRALERGECLVLIDAADTLPARASALDLATGLAQLVARYPNNRYLVCAREPSLALPEGFVRYTLAALGQPQRDALIERWYALAGPAAGLASTALPSHCATLRAALQAAALLPLAQSPLTLGLCVLAHAQGAALPAQRALVLGWQAAWLAGQPSADEWPALAGLARALHADQPLAATAAHALLAGLPGQHDPDVLLERWCAHGILARGPAGFSMPEQATRAYLAARALAALPDFPAQVLALRADPRWREGLLLACELAGAGAPAQALAAHDRLLAQAAGDLPGALPELLLAAEALLAIGAAAPAQRAPDLAARLLPALRMPELPVPERIAAGLLLGRLGDPRLSALLPALAQVPAGAFLLGTVDGYDDEGPPQLLVLAEYAIGVHPVTNQEYARFLAEQAHAEPHFWHDPRLNNPACPVVGVTWHDALAYCAWLTARLRGEGLLPAGAVVRLPSEYEWEKAASWDAERAAKRRYPWGDTWQPGYANTADGRGDWLTAPVGCFPSGVSAYGLHDCIGNVWEWTASQYASYPGAAQPFHEPGAYALRGSSCVTNSTHARCTYRSRLPPSYWRHHLGFRVVVGPA